ncbi:hypothetical protein [Williamsia sterculiae]|uniref:Uncharacterized protein n=1 Tax=Williamsia sterculiae TaxID=1344003 RepID=A0A1N7H125_9NOCA|nr:hypothetical protein [Williamsia sterculiae]SIS18523.1 hypothetical protein SAMN05445060_3344 [Williamsia sterculiae]
MTGPDSADAYQLATIDDIPGEVLAAPGNLLRDFFPPDRDYAVVAHLSEVLHTMPATGWRLIQHRDNNDLRRDTIAAPSHLTPGAWIVLYSTRGGDGRWIISTGGEGWTFPAVPTRSHRRRDLRLQLGETTSQVGTAPLIYPTLTNTGTTAWHNVADDTPTVLVWILDTNGAPIAERGFMTWGSVGTLPDLEPGESTVLYAADLKTPNAESLPPGTYTLTGMLHSLGLRTEPGSLHIT